MVADMFEKLAVRDRKDSVTLHKQYDRAAVIELLTYIKHAELFLDRLEAAASSSRSVPMKWTRFSRRLPHSARPSKTSKTRFGS